MEKYSKFFALVLTLALVAAMSGYAFADEAPYSLPVGTGEQLTILTPDLNSSYPNSLNTQGQEEVTFEILDRIEEMLGVDFVFEAIPSDYATVLSTRLAANVDMPDIILGFNQNDANKFGQQGVILDLRPYLDKYDTWLEKFLEYEPDAISYFESPDGGIYSYGTILTGYEWADPYGFQIRGDWLEASGMDLPESIQDWTALFGYWYENDMNGNGNPNDEIPFTPRSKSLKDTLIWMCAWGLAGYNSDGWEAIDGKIIYDYVQDEMKECIKVLADWYAKGYLDNDFLNITNVNEKLSTSTTGATNGWANNLMSRTTLIQQGGCEEGWMTAAKAPNAEGYTSRLDTRLGFTGNSAAITTACKNPDLAFLVVDWMVASPDSMIINWFGFEGEQYTGEPNYDSEFWKKMIFDEGYASKDYYLIANGGRLLFPNFRAGSGPWGVFTDAYASGQSDYAKESQERVTEALVPGFPNLLATQDEQDMLDMYMTDITSYINQTLASFIMDDIDIDAEWDNYVAQVYKMGLQEVIDIKQGQYDRIK